MTPQENDITSFTKSEKLVLSEHDILEIKRSIEFICSNYKGLVIFAEIFVCKSISVSDLLNKFAIKALNIKKSTLYNLLNELENAKFILSLNKSKGAKKGGFPRLSYEPNFAFLGKSAHFINQNSASYPRLSRLFMFYTINAFLNREIQKLLVSTDEEIQQECKIRPDHLTGYSSRLDFLSKDVIEKVKQHTKEIDSAIFKYDEQDKLEPNLFFYGFLKVEELEDS